MDEPMNTTPSDGLDGSTAEEARLASTLRAQGDRIEPDPGSLLRLREQLASAQAGGEGRSGHRFGFAPQQLAIAAVILAVAIFSVAALTRTPSQEIDTANDNPTTTLPTTTTAPTTTEPIEEDEAPLDDVASEGEADGVEADSTSEALPDVASAEGFVAGPIRRTREEAAAAFMALIRLPYAGFDIKDDRALVLSLDENGDPSDTVAGELRFETTTGESGTIYYAVAEATNAGMTIESPAPGATFTDSTITVAGEGSGFEASVAVRLISSFDGLMLDQQPTLAGWELSPYEVSVEATGREHGWVVAISDVPVDFVTPPFSAVPVEWDLEPDATTYTVSHIDLDDEDGGLNLRSTPSLGEGEVLETLPAGTSGIRRRGRLPAFVGGSVFWAVTTPSGGEGWVNRRFLVRDGDIDDEILLAVGNQFAQSVSSGNAVDMMWLPWSTAKPVLVGWPLDLPSIDGASMSTEAFWDTPRTWAVPEETFSVGEITETPLRFMSPALELTVSVRAEGAASSSYPIVQDWINTEFAGLEAVEVSAVDVAGGDVDRSFTLFLEPGPEGPQIVGVAVHLWIP